jgi:hypothetical protein
MFKNINTNPKLGWKAIKPFINSNSNTKNDNITIKSNDILITDNEVLSNKFNNFFIESVTNTIDSISTNQLHLTTPLISLQNNISIKNTFYFNKINNNTMYKMLLKCKKYNNTSFSITPKIINDNINKLSIIFTYLFNLMVESQVFPDYWKTAKVIPVFKNGNTQSVENYRPISTLSNVSNVFERILSQQILNFLNNNNILSKNQHGFQAHKSTSTCIGDFLNYIYTSKCTYKYVVTVFLDFSKAFDIVIHELLYKKLKDLGFSTEAINLIKSYFSNRKQYVNCNKTNSNVKDLNHGVVQGSVLGPLFFILFSNDLPTFILFCKIFMYADDTSISLAGNNLQHLIESINSDLDIINKYCMLNFLKLNTKKCKAMIFTNCKNFDTYPIKIGSDEICIVNEYKFLGLLLDNNLKFNLHCDNVKNKLTSAYFAINKSRQFLPQKATILLFNAIGLPHINYCSVFYLFGCNTQFHKQIESQYIDCGRCILWSNKYDGISKNHVLNTLKWKSLNKILLTNMFMYAYNIYNNTNTVLSNSLNITDHCHNTRLRSSNKFKITQIKNKQHMKSFDIWGPRILNIIPHNTYRTLNVLSFRSFIDNFIDGLSDDDTNNVLSSL